MSQNINIIFSKIKKIRKKIYKLILTQYIAYTSEYIAIFKFDATYRSSKVGLLLTPLEKLTAFKSCLSK